MKYKKYYMPPNALLWQGRADSLPDERFFQRVKWIDLTKETLETVVMQEKPAFAVVGFCCDVGVRRNLGRIGAKQGPMALRQALAKLPIHGNSPLIFYDVGDIRCDQDELEEAQSALGEVIKLLLSVGLTPIVCGGGHEVAYGHYLGIAKVHPHTSLGIINFDAHFDLRPLVHEKRGNSGTPFQQIALHCHQQQRSFDYLCIGIQALANTRSLFARARELHVETITAEEVNQQPVRPEIWARLEDFVKNHEALYVSICLDVFAEPFAPGVSAPQPFGVLPLQVVPWLRYIAQSRKVISFDIAELSPPLDREQMTAKLGAGMIFEMVHGMKIQV